MIKINFYFIFAAVCIGTSYTMHATQASLEQLQRKATPLELQMLQQATDGSLNQERLVAYLKQGADINAKNNTSGNTALIIATSFGYPEIVRQLIAANADINARNNNGVTALMLAANFGNTDNVHQLIAAGADINAKNNNGLTALMFAAREGRINIVEELVAAGADFTIQNEKDNNKTARDYVGITRQPNPDFRNMSIIAYDKAVAAGLKKREDDLARQAEAKRIMNKKPSKLRCIIQ